MRQRTPYHYSLSFPQLKVGIDVVGSVDSQETRKKEPTVVGGEWV